MLRTGLAVLLVGSLGTYVVAQDRTSRGADPSVEQKIEALQRQINELKENQSNTGRSGNAAPVRVSADYASVRRTGVALPQEGVSSNDNERLKIGGRIDFEFYDINAQRASRGVYDGNVFGGNGGNNEFRVRRVQLMLGMELIEDFVFQSTLTLDPVVRDDDEGAIDVDEAYVRFGNVVRNIFGVEDPTHSYIQVGNFYRWERDFLNRWSESFSLAGTSFYRDEVTGLQIGGDLEMGFFWRATVDNGTRMTARDAGVGATRGFGIPPSATGNSPMFHDNEQLGDLNNSKDVSIGVGFKDRMEEPKFEYGLAVSYRHGRLSNAERALLAGTTSAYDGTRQKNRFGIMATGEFDFDTFSLGGNAEFWFANDGNGEREAWSLGPYVKLPLDGVYYQQRLFFTGIGAGYRWSGLHLGEGFTNTTVVNPQTHILDDRNMHTVDLWIDVTRNVDLRFEFNNVDPNNGDRGTESEWLVQWTIRF